MVPGARVKFWPPIPSWPGVVPDGLVNDVTVPQYFAVVWLFPVAVIDVT